MSLGKGRQRWRCRRCNKVAFGSRSRALESAQRRHDDHNTDYQRAYPCPIGNGWHLTSEEVRSA